MILLLLPGAILALIGCIALIFDPKVWQLKTVSRAVRSWTFWRWILLALIGCVLFIIGQP